MLATVQIGAWIGRGQQDLSSYLLGGREVPWWAILGSIVATETSTATFLSVPGIAFASEGDMRFLQLAFGYIVGRILVASILLPLYFRGKIFTAYEVLEHRFGGAVKQVASLMFLVARNVGDGLRLFLAGIALEKVVGIELHYAIIAIGLATIVYTFFGGMKAVIWSDCVQLVIYMIGGVIALALLIRSLPNGMDQFIEFGTSTGRFQVFDFRVSSNESFSFWSEPYTFWAGLLGGAALTLGTHGTDQMMVQRYLSARSQRDAKKAIIASGLVVLVQFALFLLLGVALAAFYTIVSPQAFRHNDQVFASYIVDFMPIGLVGLTLAAVFAAAMSTLSSSLNSSAAAVVSDFIARERESEDVEKSSGRLLAASRIATICFGVVQIIIGIGASYVSKSVVGDALAIAGFTAGILLGVFLLGAATKSANEFGVVVAIGTAIGALAFLRFQTSVAWPWYPVVGCLTTVGVGWFTSRITSRRILKPEEPS